MSDKRSEIIATARELDNGTVQLEAEHDGPGTYEHTGDQELAVAIEVIYGHGVADATAGSTQYGLHGARVGCYVLWTSDQGFTTLDEYESAEKAQEALDAEDAEQGSEEES